MADYAKAYGLGAVALRYFNACGAVGATARSARTTTPRPT